MPHRRRTRIPRSISGKLLPMAPPGASTVGPGSAPMPTGVVRTPRPSPTARGEDLRKSDFIAMPASAVYYADAVLSMENGGLTRWIAPKVNPVILSPSTTQAAIIDTGVEYDQYVIAAIGHAERTAADPAAGVPSILYNIDVRRRNMGAQSQTDQGWVAFSSVFGTGRYPHYFAIPLPIPCNTQFPIELRNQTALNLQVTMSFLVIAKQAMNPNRIDVHQG